MQNNWFVFVFSIYIFLSHFNWDSINWTAKDFLEGMNKSVDPCDDFYEYVCGGWNNLAIIPYWETSWSVFQQYQLIVFTRIKGN